MHNLPCYIIKGNIASKASFALRILIMTEKYPITITINGTEYQRNVEPRPLLSDFIQHKIGLTGTHVGCEHGVCDACTILFDGEAVRSCTYPYHVSRFIQEIKI